MSAPRLLATTLTTVVLVLPSTAHCEPPRESDGRRTVVVTDELRATAGAANAFAFDLYARLKSTDGNLFFSPASISTALAMTYGGAAGETKQQMAAVLHFELPGDRLHGAQRTLGEILNASNKNYRLSTANRLWGAEGFPFQPQFLALTRDAYGAELEQLDFSRTEEARATINGWVAQQTNDRIQDLIPPNVLDPETRLVLTNAIFFKGNWAEAFEPKATGDAPFRLASGDEVTVPLMRQTGRFRYGEAEGLQVLELAYAGGDIAMLVLLPKEVGLDALEKKLTVENVSTWSSGLARKEVEVFLPRFKTTSEFQLGETLSAMGMPLAFSDNADFSAMSSAEELKLSEVIHKAFVEVNEQGTEAAAATGALIQPTAAPSDDEKPPVFRADRPFVFLIRDRRTGGILFLGRMNDPSS